MWWCRYVTNQSSRPRPIELLSRSPHVVAGVMRLQLACQELQPPMHAMNALGAWHILVGSYWCST